MLRDKIIPKCSLTRPIVKLAWLLLHPDLNLTELIRTHARPFQFHVVSIKWIPKIGQQVGKNITFTLWPAHNQQISQSNTYGSLPRLLLWILTGKVYTADEDKHRDTPPYLLSLSSFDPPVPSSSWTHLVLPSLSPATQRFPAASVLHVVSPPPHMFLYPCKIKSEQNHSFFLITIHSCSLSMGLLHGLTGNLIVLLLLFKIEIIQVSISHDYNEVFLILLFWYFCYLTSSV